MKTRALVQYAAEHFELQELEVPPTASAGALLRVEACGLCGTDIEQYHARQKYLRPASFPMIPGHEMVGIIEEIGPEARQAWGVAAGDRVVVAPHLVCNRCAFCLRGDTHLCKGIFPTPRSQYGFMPLAYEHGLWGGYSEYLPLHPATRLWTVPPAIPAPVAAMYQALAAGLRWAVHVPHTAAADTVLVLGCGQRGLASVVALRAAGVEEIIVTGLSRDRHKLAEARRLGARHTIVVDEEQTVERVMAITGGRGVEVAVDVAPGSIRPFLDAVDVMATGGTIVVAGLKDGTPAPLDTNRLIYKEVTIRGVFTQQLEFYGQAVDLLTERFALLEPLHTHDFALEDLSEAIAVMSGERSGVESVCVTLRP